MTRFISMRAQDIGGPVVPALAWESASAPTPVYQPVETWRVEQDTARKDVILAVHGFNVSRPKGVRSLAALEAALMLTDDQIFFGVLWPGDFWLPVVNYPAGAGEAVKAGGYLADYLNAHMPTASSFSFISHSLGGRVLLAAVTRLARPAREVCITAGAVDDDCLSGQYATAKANSERLSVLASGKDGVLSLAYPLGDFVSDVFWGDDDSPWHGALGLHGPHPFQPPPKVSHRQIPDSSDYGHGDYFPPSDFGAAVTPARWNKSAAYMRRALNGEPDRWS